LAADGLGCSSLSIAASAQNAERRFSADREWAGVRADRAQWRRICAAAAGRWPIWLVSFAVPSLAISLRRE
jgi:hypothetical protein